MTSRARRGRSGLTLVEMLAALTLLGSLVLGAGFWVREASAVGLERNRSLNSERAIVALLDAVERDLRVGDLDVAYDEKKGEARVKVGTDSLTIATRASRDGLGAVTHEYTFRKANGEVLCVERSSDVGAARSVVAAPRVLLGGVVDCRFDLDPKAKPRELHVLVATDAKGSRTFERRWRLP